MEYLPLYFLESVRDTVELRIPDIKCCCVNFTCSISTLEKWRRDLKNINSGATLDKLFACESGHAASQIRTEVEEFWFAGASVTQVAYPFPVLNRGYNGSIGSL